MKAILDWLDQRTGYRHLTKEALYENIPGGSRWQYVTGSMLVFAFVTQAVTGIFLWMAYSPSSTTAYIGHLKSPAATAVDAKICRTLGIHAAYSEGIQAQRYDVGQQFKPHWDAFEPGSEAFQRFGGVRGNRTWTFMIYLNEDMEGGATRFTELDIAVRPKTGMALLWNNLNADGSPNLATKHCGEPVTRGHKVIITKWFRVHGDGPVLDESAYGARPGAPPGARDSRR